MLDWHIQARAHHCQVSGKAFEDGQPFHTVLLANKEGFERLDLDPAVWKESSGEILNRPNYVSHWRSVYHVPPPAPPEPIRKDDAITLLRKLMALENPDYGPAIFILAAMLERKRVLRVKKQARESGRRTTVYEQAKTGDVFVVVDPELQLDQLESVQRDVAELLEHGLPGERSVEESTAEFAAESQANNDEPSLHPNPDLAPTLSNAEVSQEGKDVMPSKDSLPALDQEPAVAPA